MGGRGVIGRRSVAPRPRGGMAGSPMGGSASRQRYEESVAELREAVQQESKGCRLVDDRALEIEPMRPHGGRQAVLSG